MNLSEITTEIETLRQQLVDKYLLIGSMNSAEVIRKSTELDDLLNRYDRLRSKELQLHNVLIKN